MASLTKFRCVVGNCNKARKSRGLCGMHYQQLRAAANDVTKAKFYDLVKSKPEALALINKQEAPVAVAAVPVIVPETVRSGAKDHDAWVAAYAFISFNKSNMDAFLNMLVSEWYERNFPNLVKGPEQTFTVHAH